MTKQDKTFTVKLITFKTVSKNYKTSGLYLSKEMEYLQWLNGSAMPVLDTIHKIYRNTASQPTQKMHVSVIQEALLISLEYTHQPVHNNYINFDCIGQVVTKL